MPATKRPRRTAPPQQANTPTTQTVPTAPPPVTSVPGGSGTLTPQQVDLDNTTDFEYLGWFTVSAEGCTVQFGIDQQRYFLALTAPNYNALFSMLLTCWVDRHKVSLRYRSPLLGGAAQVAQDPNAPLSIISLVTI
jgi:hypothetical protein